MQDAQNPAEIEYAQRLSEAITDLDAALDKALAQLAAGDVDAAVRGLEAPVKALGRTARDA